MQSRASQVLEYTGVDGKHSEVVVKKGQSQVSFDNKGVLYCSSAEATIWEYVGRISWQVSWIQLSVVHWSLQQSPWERRCHLVTFGNLPNSKSARWQEYVSRQGGKSTWNRETCETDEHQQVASKSLEEELRICFDPIENRASILEWMLTDLKVWSFLSIAHWLLYTAFLCAEAGRLPGKFMINVKQCKFTFACVSHTFATVPRHFCWLVFCLSYISEVAA